MNVLVADIFSQLAQSEFLSTLKYHLALQKQTAENYISHTPLKLVNVVPAIRHICVNLIR